MDQHGSGMVPQFPDSPFSHTILPMSIDPTEGKGLLVVLNGLAPFGVSKDPIVCMVVLYPYPMLSTEGLKSFFALNCLFSTVGGL
jgi:hypothetical protein